MAAQFLILCSIGLYAKPNSFSLKPKTPIQIRKNKFWLRNFPSNPNRIHLNTDSLKRKVKVENILKFPASRNLGTLKIQQFFLKHEYFCHDIYISLVLPRCSCWKVKGWAETARVITMFLSVKWGLLSRQKLLEILLPTKSSSNWTSSMNDAIFKLDLTNLSHKHIFSYSIFLSHNAIELIYLRLILFRGRKISNEKYGKKSTRFFPFWENRDLSAGLEDIRKSSIKLWNFFSIQGRATAKILKFPLKS